MIGARLISWVETVAAIYAILLATYVASCLVVGRLNRRIAAAKIQSRETSPALVRRDQKQSLVSLAAIAALFGTGHWLYAEFGWGLAPARGVLGMRCRFLPRWCCSTPGSTGSTG